MNQMNESGETSVLRNDRSYDHGVRYAFGQVLAEGKNEAPTSAGATEAGVGELLVEDALAP